jgi:hypothetical protein
VVGDHAVEEQLARLDALRVLQRGHLVRRHHSHRVAAIAFHVVAAVAFVRRGRDSPLTQPVLHLLDLGGLRGLDLGGQVDDPGVDALLGQHDVAHLDRLLVVRDHALGESGVRVVVIRTARGRRRAVLSRVLRTRVATAAARRKNDRRHGRRTGQYRPLPRHSEIPFSSPLPIPPTGIGWQV